MKLLQKIWNDVRRGENIDLYITIFFAIGLVPLNILGVASDRWIPSLTLAILGLLAISILGNRYRDEEFAQKFSRETEFFSDAFPRDIDKEIESAPELWMIGATLAKTITTNYALFENKLRKGHKIKVLLIHPEGSSIDMMATRYYAPKNRSPETQASKINNSLQLFCDLKKISLKNLEIRTVKSSLSFGAYAINPSTNTGTLYLEHYPFRTISTSQPKFVLKASDGKWYEFFKREIQSLWEAGEVWEAQDEA